jgi:hypothetical protein
MNESSEITTNGLDRAGLVLRTNERRWANIVLSVEMRWCNNMNFPAIPTGTLDGMSQGAIGANDIGVANGEYSSRQCHRRILPESCAESDDQQ